MDASENPLPSGIQTISLDDFVFHQGVLAPRQRRTPVRSRVRALSSVINPPPLRSWSERILTPPAPGTLRILDPPVTAAHMSLESLWFKDMTLADWVYTLEDAKADVSENPIAVAFRPPNYIQLLEDLFYGNQRKRWLAHVVRQRWCQRIWRKKTQCNIDMIDMLPISDKDSIFLTDTKHRQIYRFHKRDVVTNLLSNICMSDEMLPTPRAPTNPWTNSKLTMPQTMTICQQIVADYASRGLCPPVLFAAFWASRFCLRRFHEDNSALLSQHAVRSYFKDLHDDNMVTVFDTILNLLQYSDIQYSAASVRRWLRQTPQTPLHREWLTLARDYTLYINLHVQVRSNWYAEEYIYADVRRLYNRTTFPPPASARMQLLREAVGQQLPPLPQLPLLQPQLQSPLYSIFSLPMLFDGSGSAMTNDAALELIRNALFRM